MIANGDRKFLPFSLFSYLRKIYSINLKKARFVEEVLLYPKT